MVSTMVKIDAVTLDYLQHKIKYALAAFFNPKLPSS